MTVAGGGIRLGRKIDTDGETCLRSGECGRLCGGLGTYIGFVP